MQMAFLSVKQNLETIEKRLTEVTEINFFNHQNSLKTKLVRGEYLWSIFSLVLCVFMCLVFFPTWYSNIGMFRDCAIVCVSPRFWLHGGRQKGPGRLPLSPGSLFCHSIIPTLLIEVINLLAPCSDFQARASELLSLNQTTLRLLSVNCFSGN